MERVARRQAPRRRSGRLRPKILTLTARSTAIAKTLNILFTCGGRRVALIEAFRRAMGELDLAGECIVTDVTSASAAWQCADRGLIVPRCDHPGYLSAIEDAVARHDVGLLVPLTDLDLLLLAERRDELAARGCLTMISSPQAVATCRDKVRTARWLAEIGATPIRSETLETFRADPFYPCFVKPVSGSSSVGARRVDGPEQLAGHVAAFGENLLLQECLEGQEFTVDVYRLRGGPVKAVVPRQRLDVRAGEVQNAVTVRDEELIGESRRIAESLPGLWGAACLQFRRPVDATGKPAGPARCFEINPRFGGGVPLTIAAGADLPLYLLQETTSQPVDGPAGVFTENLVMLRYDDAVFAPTDSADSLPGWREPRFR
jgi:carbamoyl-phosphate synthase large subunit